MSDENTIYAYPQGMSSGSLSVSQGGMTLRDYFAGQALANSAICDGKASDWQTAAWFGKYASGITKAQIVAKQAGEYADAMLAERAK